MPCMGCGAKKKIASKKSTKSPFRSSSVSRPSGGVSKTRITFGKKK